MFCLPSVEPSEAFGIVQVEAMACGRPVVCSDLKNGVNWVNPDGVTGLAVPPRDERALALALTKLLEDRDLRERLEDLENAWAVDETIQPDGSLKPSVADTVKRAAELEAENVHLRQENEDHIQSINEMCNGLWELLYPDNPNGWQYRTQPLVHIRVELEELRDQLEGGLDG